jgi:DNA-directed RNA polymerase specialized sigma24 family protein
VTTLLQIDLEARFYALYDDLSSRIITYIRNLTLSCPDLDAEDLAQATWERCWRTMSAGNTIHAGYVFATARSVALDARRRTGRYLRIFNPLRVDLPIEDGICYGDLIPDTHRDFTELVESHDLRQPIQVVLASMKKAGRTAMLLGVEGYTNVEIGQMRGVCTNTAKTARNRGQRTFRARWKEETEKGEHL